MPTHAAPASRPTRAAAGTVRLATLLLPAGTPRDRYRQELLAELWWLDAHAQRAFARHSVPAAWALRRTLTGRGPTFSEDQMTRPLLCLLNIHHHWHGYSTEDGQRYLRCDRCGTDKMAVIGAQRRTALPPLGGG